MLLSSSAVDLQVTDGLDGAAGRLAVFVCVSIVICLSDVQQYSKVSSYYPLYGALVQRGLKC